MCRATKRKEPFQILELILDISQLITNLVPEVQKAIIFGSATFFIAIAFYLRRRFIDKRWLRKHELVLFVYFRNVEWRCQRLQSAGSALLINDLMRLRLELTKLQSDIDALDRLFEMWNRRMKFIRLSFGYVRQFDDAHDAFTELQICLLRHIQPLLEMLSVESNTAGVKDEKLHGEAEHYIAYFNGGTDRIWGAGLVGEGKEAYLQERAPLTEMRRIGLHKRIERLHETLMILFHEIGGIKTGELRIWNTNEEEGVWFKDRGFKSET